MNERNFVLAPKAEVKLKEIKLTLVSNFEIKLQEGDASSNESGSLQQKFQDCQGILQDLAILLKNKIYYHSNLPLAQAKKTVLEAGKEVYIGAYSELSDMASRYNRLDEDSLEAAAPNLEKELKIFCETIQATYNVIFQSLSLKERVDPLKLTPLTLAAKDLRANADKAPGHSHGWKGRLKGAAFVLAGVVMGVVGFLTLNPFLTGGGGALSTFGMLYLYEGRQKGYSKKLATVADKAENLKKLCGS